MGQINLTETLEAADKVLNKLDKLLGKQKEFSY